MNSPASGDGRDLRRRGRRGVGRWPSTPLPRRGSGELPVLTDVTTMKSSGGADSVRKHDASPGAIVTPVGGPAGARAQPFDRLAKLAASLLNVPVAVIVRSGAAESSVLGGFGLGDDLIADALARLSVLDRGRSGDAVSCSDKNEPAIEIAAFEGAFLDECKCGVDLLSGGQDIRFAAYVRIRGRKERQQAVLWVIGGTSRELTASDEGFLADVAALIGDALDREDLAGEAPPRAPSGVEFAAPHEQALIHSVLNALFVFVGILDRDGTLLDANDPPLRAASLDIDDVKGKPFWECYWWAFTKPAQDRLREAVERALAGEDVRYDADVRVADNAFITIDFCLSPLRDVSGRITHLVASGVDISRRHRAESELRRMARIVDDSPFLIRSATPDGKILYLNRYGRELLGYAPGSDLANAEVSHHHPEWAMRLLRDEGYPTARKENVWLGETAIIDTDGREVPTSHAIVAHRDSDGSVEYFSSIAIDISGQKAAEAALKESELRFRSTFENAAVGMAHIALHGRWLRANERLLEILGYGRADLVQLSFQDITHPDDLQKDQEMIQKLRDGAIDSYALQNRVYRKDGTLVWVEITVSMQEKSGQNEPYFISIIEDITKRKEAEQRQRLLLAELNHRVKNTLAMIQSIANQTLRQSSDPRSFVARFTGRIQSLSGAHDLLTAQTWDGADLAELLRTQVSLNGTIDEERIRLTGPALLLPPQVALNLALVIHELATNAVQHGAFASDQGKIAVSWSISDKPPTGDTAGEKRLEIAWKESGGPPVRSPHQHGFGTVILERGLKQGLGGVYDLDWRSEGLLAHIEIPLPAAAFRSELFFT